MTVTKGLLFTVQTLSTVPAVVTWLKLNGLLITGTKKLAAEIMLCLLLTVQIVVLLCEVPLI